MEFAIGREIDVLYFLQSIRFEPLTGIMKFISLIGEAGVVWIAFAVILLCIKKYRYAGLTSAISLLMEYIVTNRILKVSIGRVRPYVMYSGLDILGVVPNDASFPSGHSGAAFAVATVMLVMLPKKYGVPAFVLACLMAFSRLYLGAHFPSDVIAGIAIGCLFAFIAYKIMHTKKINSFFCKDNQKR